MREINKLIVHCSASDNLAQDSAEAITELHTGPRSKKIDWGNYKNVSCFEWDDNGYQFVITKDGTIHFCRPVHIPGAHAQGHNHDSIGICLTGDQDFSEEQFESLRFIVRELCHEFGLNLTKVYPHNHFAKKGCPNFDLKKVLAKAA